MTEEILSLSDEREKKQPGNNLPGRVMCNGKCVMGKRTGHSFGNNRKNECGVASECLLRVFGW